MRRKQITFLVPSAFYAGGIARVVSTQANVLVDRGYQVKVITLVRGADRPRFHFDPRVELIPLQDLVGDGSSRVRRARHNARLDPALRALDNQPSQLATRTHKSFSAYVDRRLEEELSALEPGVVITTRPEFAVAATRWCDPASILIHQEHLSFVPRPEPLRRALRSVARGDDGARRIDALLTLTDADRDRWAEYVADASVRIEALPNPIPFAIGPASPLSSRVVLAAGRMTEQKGFTRLVDAYAPLARSHPDWELRIFGTGPEHDRLLARAADLGVTDKVAFPGVTDDFEAEISTAAIYAMSSRWEGLPMVLLEALSKGVPPVSFDCPEGPRQLIDDGVNGLLVEDGDIDALTAALRAVMDDDGLRRRLGEAALASAASYEAGAVVDRWLDLIDQLASAREV